MPSVSAAGVCSEHFFFKRVDIQAIRAPGVVLVGLLVPLAVTVSVLAGDGVPSQGVLVLRVGCAVLGDAVLRYVITKCGRYSPLIYSNLVKR